MISLLESRFKNGLVGYWTLGDEATYDGTENEVKDHSSNAGHAVCINGATQSSQKVGEGIAFEATQFVHIYSTPATAISGDLSITAWIKSSNQVKTSMFILHSSTALNSRNYDFQCSSGILGYRHGRGGGTEFENSGIQVCDGTWKHVVVTCKSKVCTFYVNGAQVAQTAMTFDNVANSSTRWISHSSTANNTWDGSIDEVGLWNRALTAIEVKEMYNAGIGRRNQFNASVKGMINDNLVGDMTEEM